MRIRPLRGLFCLLCLIFVSAIPPVSLAQEASQFDVLSVSAEATFPDSIDFQIEFRSDLNVLDVELYWKAAGASAFTLAEPEITRGDITTARYQADTSARYFPPGIDIEYFWRGTGEDGHVHDTPTSTILYIDERFEWKSIDGGLLSVWWYTGSDEYATTILNAANQALIHLDERYGLRADEHIRILVYGNNTDFDSAMPPNSADWIGGVAYSSLNHIIAQITPGGSAARESGRMIPHEVSHVVVHQASRNPYNTPPPWLDEGLATYIQEVDDGRLSSILDRAVREGRLIPLGALKSSFPVDPDQALLSYAESVSVVSYLVDTYGAATVGELVTVYEQDVSHDESVEAVLGMTIEELDAGWKASLGYQGDRPPGSGSTSSNVRAVAIIGTAVIATALIASTVVLRALWRTRVYREGEEESTPISGGEENEPTAQL